MKQSIASSTATRNAAPHARNSDVREERSKPNSDVLEAVTILSQMSGLLQQSHGQANENGEVLFRTSQQSCGFGDLQQDFISPSQTLPSQPDIPLPATAMAAAQHPSRSGQAGSPSKAQPGLDTQASNRTSKGTRRGPMDEMRQLARILVKIIPHSVGLLTVGDEGGGGNRITEEQIKSYLSKTLGEAPHPQWGVPSGWGAYLAELFTWCAGRPITEEQAMRCAKREPGRSWEALDIELNRLGLRPETWPLPLTKAGMDEARNAPTVQPHVSGEKVQPAGTTVTGVKRPAEEKQLAPSAAKRRVSHLKIGLEPLTELQLWYHAMDVVQALQHKQGSNPLEVVSELVQVRKQVVEALNDHLRKPVSPMVPAPMPTCVPAAVQTPTGASSGALEVRPMMIQDQHGQLVRAFQLSNTQLTQPLTLMNGLQSLGLMSSEGLLALQGMPAAAITSGLPYACPANLGAFSDAAPGNQGGASAPHSGLLALASPALPGLQAGGASTAGQPQAGAHGVIRPKATKLAAGMSMDLPMPWGQVGSAAQGDGIRGPGGPPDDIVQAAAQQIAQAVAADEQARVFSGRNAAEADSGGNALFGQDGVLVASQPGGEAAVMGGGSGSEGLAGLIAPMGSLPQMSFPGLTQGLPGILLPGRFAVEGGQLVPVRSAASQHGSERMQQATLGALAAAAPGAAYAVGHLGRQQAAKVNGIGAGLMQSSSGLWKASLAAVMNE